MKIKLNEFQWEKLEKNKKQKKRKKRKKTSQKECQWKKFNPNHNNI